MIDEPMLRVTGLACGYPHASRNVLQDVSFQARRGRFVCIIGPNGAGKTTLLRTLAGLLPARAGRVELGGDAIETLKAGDRARRLAVVLTHADAPGYITVERLVGLGRHPYTGFLARLTDDDRDVVERALEQTGITHLRARWVTELSDGERQRAAVARALAQASDVMILDEPTAFLDVAARAALMSTLRSIAHRTGRLIVTTSHDVELVLRTADTVFVIRTDASVHGGSPEDLILSGAIGSLFDQHALRFDEATGSFRLPSPSGPPVRVIGNGLALMWTAHAVERIGRPVVGESDADVTIRIVDGTPRRWIVRDPNGERSVDSIEALAEILRE